MGFILMQGTLLYRNIRTYQQSVTKDFASHKKESARNFEVVVKFVLVPFVNKMKTVVFSLFLLIAIAHVAFAAVGALRGPGGPGGEPPVFDCTGKVGYFADLWRNCEVYYHCLEDGTKETYGCPRNPNQLLFDESISQCVSPDVYTCPDPTA